MKNLFAELLWKNYEIDEAADQICQALPGYQEAKRTYDELSEQVQSIVGCDLYDEFFTQLMRYSNYEVYAYYSLGLGLRKDVIQALGL